MAFLGGERVRKKRGSFPQDRGRLSGPAGEDGRERKKEAEREREKETKPSSS